jgi:hypothetical protein
MGAGYVEGYVQAATARDRRQMAKSARLRVDAPRPLERAPYHGVGTNERLTPDQLRVMVNRVRVQMAADKQQRSAAYFAAAIGNGPTAAAQVVRAIDEDEA